VGLCYDDPEITAAERLRYDACLVLPDEHLPRELPAGLVRRQLPAGRYAVVLHHGPYDTLDAAYIALLGQWLPVRGVELADEPVFEIYLDDPALTPAAELRTEICVRIE
jgi:AraC family transcriptional regulator